MSEEMKRFAEEVEKCIRELASTPSTASALMMVASAARAAANGAGDETSASHGVLPGINPDSPALAARDERDARIKQLEDAVRWVLEQLSSKPALAAALRRRAGL